jgi:predicted nuclease of predicted toxin-antitoxin system
LTAPRFLIDENLSVKLPEVAHKRGFEATHVIHLGLGEWRDWNILEIVESHGWVLVTNNAVEFRSRYRMIGIHPGVIFLLPSARRELQLLLFEAALDDVKVNPDLTNQALDIDLSENARVIIRRAMRCPRSVVRPPSNASRLNATLRTSGLSDGGIKVTLLPAHPAT